MNSLTKPIVGASLNAAETGMIAARAVGGTAGVPPALADNPRDQGLGIVVLDGHISTNRIEKLK